MIWTYSDIAGAPPGNLNIGELMDSLNECVFCKNTMRNLGSQGSTDIDSPGRLVVRVCDVCGWWSAEHTSRSLANKNSPNPLLFTHNRFGFGSLKNLDVADIHQPLDELRRYLLAKYSDRFVLHPKLFEEIVGGVFADFGYRVRVTSFSGDHGIDVVALDGSTNDVVGIQVKRYQGKVEAEQIRAFAGALLLGQYTNGIFVTTSDYSRGAEHTAKRYNILGIPIELVNGKEFYEKMRIASRPLYEYLDDPNTPFQPLLKDPARIPYRGYDHYYI